MSELQAHHCMAPEQSIWLLCHVSVMAQIKADLKFCRKFWFLVSARFPTLGTPMILAYLLEFSVKTHSKIIVILFALTSHLHHNNTDLKNKNRNYRKTF